MKGVLLFGIWISLVSCDQEKGVSAPGPQEPVVVVIENGGDEDPVARQKAIDDAVEEALAKRDQAKAAELKQAAGVIEEAVEIPKAVRVVEPMVREDGPKEADRKRERVSSSAPEIPEASPAGLVDKAPMKKEGIPEARPVEPEVVTGEGAPRGTKEENSAEVEEIPEAKPVGPGRPAEVVKPVVPGSAPPVIGKEEVTGGSQDHRPGDEERMADGPEETSSGREANEEEVKPIVPSLNVERPKLDFEDTKYFHSFKDGEEPAEGDDVLVGPWTDMTGPWGSLKDALKGVLPAANFGAGKPLDAEVLRRLGKKDSKAATLLGWYVEARSQKVRARSVYALPEAVQKGTEAVAGGAAATSGNPSPYQGLPSPGGGVAVEWRWFSACPQAGAASIDGRGCSAGRPSAPVSGAG